MIPASFFFDLKQSIDEDLESTYSDQKVSLVSLTKLSFHIDAFLASLFVYECMYIWLAQMYVTLMGT